MTRALALLLLLLPASALGQEHLVDFCSDLPAPARSLAVVDLGDDTHLDAAVATSGGLVLLRNDTSGRLYVVPDPDNGDAIWNLRGVDLVDVAVVGRGSVIDIVALAADGTATAVTPAGEVVWSAELGANATRFAWADVELDGDFDVAVGRGTSGVVDIYRRDGDTFTPLASTSGLGEVTDLAFGSRSDGAWGPLLAVGTDGYGRILELSGTTLTEISATLQPGARSVYWGVTEAWFGGVLERHLVRADTVEVEPSPVNVDPGPLVAPGWSFEHVVGGAGDDLATVIDRYGDPAYTINRPATAVDLVTAELAPGRWVAAATGQLDGQGTWVVCSAALEGCCPGSGQTTSEVPAFTAPPTAMGIGDVDRDGANELVLANAELLAGFRSGDGWVHDALFEVASPGNAGGITLRDLDADGYPELLVTIAGRRFPPPPVPADPALHIYANDGGTIASTPAWSSDIAHEAVVEPNDVDGDQVVDLVLAGTEEGVITIRPGDPEAAAWFDPEPAWQSEEIEVTAMSWGDLDQDGDLDLAVNTYQQGLVVFRNDSIPGTFDLVEVQRFIHTDIGTSVTWHDWNQDGAADLLTSESLAVTLYRNSDGVLEPVWANPEGMPPGEAVALDWDGNGSTDLAVMAPGGGGTIYRQELDGPPFGPNLEMDTLQGSPWVFGDLSGDAAPDLAFWNYAWGSVDLATRPRIDVEVQTVLPTLGAWTDPPVGRPPVDLGPVVVHARVNGLDPNLMTEIALEYSVDSGRDWTRAQEVTIEPEDEGFGFRITWDWVREGLPDEHPEIDDHPIDTDEVALRVTGVPTPPWPVAGPLVGRRLIVAEVDRLRRWPDEDHDGVPNRWDPCHADPLDDSDGDGSCDSDELCEGDDSSGDGDADGVCADSDCDDADPGVRPGIRETCLDGLDNNCDELVDLEDPQCDASALRNSGIWCTTSSSSAALLPLLVLTLPARRRRRYQQDVG